MFRNKIIDAGMYHVLQEWYKFIDNSIHVQADLIGKYLKDLFQKFVIVKILIPLKFTYVHPLKLSMNACVNVHVPKKVVYL